jgi:uncharacterized protein YecT (DUF1311 family)
MEGSRRNRLLLDATHTGSDGFQSRDRIGAAYEIRTLAHYLSKSSPESVTAIRNLVPIRVIACTEGCLKAATAELINHGEPYRSNVRRLMQQVKIDFDVLKALLEDSVTIGNIVSHTFGWHDLSEINSRMTTILGFDFLNALRTTTDRFEVERKGAPNKPIIDSLDTVLSDLNDALTIRHALSHEVAQFDHVSEPDAARFLKSGEQFTNAVAWLISETLEPGAPLTQTDMTIEAGQRAEAVREEMEKALGTLAEKLDDEEDKALLAQSQKAWQEYTHAFCVLEGNAAKGGTMSPMLRNRCTERMTKARLQEIQECLRWSGLGGKAQRRRRPR